MSYAKKCDKCEQVITATVKYWAIVLNHESHVNGGINVHDVFDLSTFCEACSKQVDLESPQIPECKLSHRTVKSECENTDLKKNSLSIFATCETCKKDIFDNTKHWSVSLNQESFTEEVNSFFATMTSVHDSSWLCIFCESCAQKKDFRSLQIPLRQLDSQETHSQLQ